MTPERSTEELEYKSAHAQSEEKRPYTPRPKSQIVLAWVLLAVVLKILSVAGALSVTGVGWLAMLLVFLAGVQLQGLGVAAFYLGKLFNEGKGRPVYIERVVLPGGVEGK